MPIECRLIRDSYETQLRVEFARFIALTIIVVVAAVVVVWNFCNLVLHFCLFQMHSARDLFAVWGRRNRSWPRGGAACWCRSWLGTNWATLGHKQKANEATITSRNGHTNTKGSNLQLNYDEMGNRKEINCPRNAIMLRLHRSSSQRTPK